MNAEDKFNTARAELDNAEREHHGLMYRLQLCELRLKHANASLDVAYEEFLRYKNEGTAASGFLK